MCCRDSRRAACGLPWLRPAARPRRDRTGGVPPPPPRHPAALSRRSTVRSGPAVGRPVGLRRVAGTPAAASRRFVGRVSWAAEPQNIGTLLRSSALRWAWKRRASFPRFGPAWALCASSRPWVGVSPVVAAAPRFVCAVAAGFRPHRAPAGGAVGGTVWPRECWDAVAGGGIGCAPVWASRRPPLPLPCRGVRGGRFHASRAWIPNRPRPRRLAASGL